MSVWCDSAGTAQRTRWLWCVFACLCVLSFVSPCELTITPPNNIYLRHGEHLNISCTSNCNLPSEDLQFKIGTLMQESRIIDNKTIQLCVIQPSIGRTVYTCTSKTKKGTPAISIVYVGPPPRNVTDFKCVVDNFQSIDCTWSKPKEDTLNTKYELTYTMNGKISDKCSLKQHLSKITCHLDNLTKPTYESSLDQFHLKATNAHGANEQFFSFNNYSIVSPKPVYNLIAKNISPHAVELNWQIDNVLKQHTFPYISLVYRIEYQIPTVNDSFRNVREETMFTENENVTYYLDQLPYAHMIYKVQIFIKIAHEDNKLWSKPRELEFETAGEKPPRPPDLPPGAFYHSNYQGMTRRIVHAYWKQLEKYEEFGANFTYYFDIKSSHSISHRVENRGYLSFESKSEDPIDLKIWSKNAEGLSVNSSKLYIPAYEDTVKLRVSSLTTRAYENGTYVLIWKNSNKVDNYTLFWCTQQTSTICKEGIEYEIIDCRTEKYTKTLPNNAKYKFAISANIGMKSSGMVWPKPECELSQETIAMSDIKFQKFNSNVEKRSVNVTWSLDCIYDGIITGYNVSYYFEDYVGEPSRRKFVYISDANQWYVFLNDLHPYTQYYVQINVDTYLGFKKEGLNISFVTKEDTPSVPRNFKIYDIKNESLVISIQPPLPLNANYTDIEYVVYNNGKEIHKVPARNIGPNDTQQIILNNLRSFTNYSLSVKAHLYHKEIDEYSDQTNSLFVRTRIGSPSKPMHVGYKDGVVSWEPPEYPGGYVDQYLIEIITDTGEGTEQQLNGTVLKYYTTGCKSKSKGNVSYRVSAVNVDTDEHHGALAFSDHVTLPNNTNEIIVYTGDFSSDIVYCDNNLIQLLYFIFAGFLSFIIIYGSLKLYRKYKEMADIDKPELPLGLRLSEQRMVVKTDNILITMDLKSRNKEISSDFTACNEEDSKDALLIKRETARDLCHKGNDYMQKDAEKESVNKLKGTITPFHVIPISSNANGLKHASASPDTENTLLNRNTRKVELLMPASNGYVSSTNMIDKPHTTMKPVTIAAVTSGYVQAMPSLSTSSIVSNGTIKQPSLSDYVHHNVLDNTQLASANRSNLLLRDNKDDESNHPDTTLQNRKIGKVDLLKPTSNDYVTSTNVIDIPHTTMKPDTTAVVAPGYVQVMPSIATSTISSNGTIKHPSLSDYVHHNVLDNTQEASDNRRNILLRDDEDDESYHPDTTLQNRKIGKFDLLRPVSDGYVSSTDVIDKPHTTLKPVTTAAEGSGYVQAMPSIATSTILSNGTIKHPTLSDYVHHNVLDNTQVASDNRSNILLRDEKDDESYHPDTTLQNRKIGKVDLLRPASDGYVSSTDVIDKPHTTMKPEMTAVVAPGYVQAMPSIPTSSILSSHKLKQLSSDYVHHTTSGSDNNFISQDGENNESYHPDESLQRRDEVDLLKPTSNGYVSSDNVMNKLISILDSEHPNNVDDRPPKNYIQFSLKRG